MIMAIRVVRNHRDGHNSSWLLRKVVAKIPPQNEYDLYLLFGPCRFIQDKSIEGYSVALEGLHCAVRKSKTRTFRSVLISTSNGFLESLFTEVFRSR